MQSKIFFFSDIDDTLIQTKRKTDFSKNTVVASYTRDGKDGSYFYDGTKIFIDTIIESGINFVPTTARGLESYQRTVFYKNTAIKYAILNFGGLVLVNNNQDEEWAKKIRKYYSEVTPIEILYANVLKYIKDNNLKLQVKIIENFYISIYNKYDLDSQKTLNTIKKLLKAFLVAEKDFYLYKNGNSFALLPYFLNKKFAVKYLIDKHQPIITLGAGDNLSDLDFMNLTNFKIIPEQVKITLYEGMNR